MSWVRRHLSTPMMGPRKNKTPARGQEMTAASSPGSSLRARPLTRVDWSAARTVNGDRRPTPVRKVHKVRIARARPAGVASGCVCLGSNTTTTTTAFEAKRCFETVVSGLHSTDQEMAWPRAKRQSAVLKCRILGGKDGRDSKIRGTGLASRWDEDGGDGARREGGNECRGC